MRKTRKDLYSAIAEKVGGERGRRMQTALENDPLDLLLVQEVSDERFNAELEKQERMSKDERPGFSLAGDSWGLTN